MATILHQLNVQAHEQVVERLRKSITSNHAAQASRLLIGAHRKMSILMKQKSCLIALAEPYIEIGVQQATALGLANEASENPRVFESLFPQ